MDCSLSNIFSILGILSSVFSMGVALYIYNGWTNQKQKEVVANDANIALEEVESLRQNIARAHGKGTVDDSFIENMKEKRGEIEFALSMIKEIKNDLEYKSYINALSELIAALQADPRSIGKRRNVDNFISQTINLGRKLAKLRLYVWE